MAVDIIRIRHLADCLADFLQLFRGQALLVPAAVGVDAQERRQIRLPGHILRHVAARDAVLVHQPQHGFRVLQRPAAVLAAIHALLQIVDILILHRHVPGVAEHSKAGRIAIHRAF